jgi:hypothetical protein
MLIVLAEVQNNAADLLAAGAPCRRRTFAVYASHSRLPNSLWAKLTMGFPIDPT